MAKKVTGYLKLQVPAGAAARALRRRLAGRAARGSVSRCPASHSVLTTHVATATPMPEAGWTWVASRVTSTGPATKMTSSATDSSENAACSSGEPPSSALHRARTIEPSCGVAAPASPLETSSAQAGAPAQGRVDSGRRRAGSCGSRTG